MKGILQDFSKAEIDNLIESLGEKKFRATQLFEGLTQGKKISEISSLSKAFKERLLEEFEDAPVREKMGAEGEGGKSRRRHRGGRRRSKAGGEAKQADKKPAEKKPAEKKNAEPKKNDKKPRRGGQSAEKPQTAQQPPKADGEATKRRRPRHRGGRRHHKAGGEGAKSE